MLKVFISKGFYIGIAVGFSERKTEMKVHSETLSGSLCWRKDTLFESVNKALRYKSATPPQLNSSRKARFKISLRTDVLFTLALVLMAFTAKSQKALTLKECIDIAIQNNQTIQESQYQKNIADIAYKQAGMQRLPNFNGGVRQGFNTGRNIDPFSNQFINQTIKTGSYSLDMDMNIFNGLQLTNTIKRNRAIQSAALNDNEAAKNVLVLSVIRLYLQVVSNQEIIKITTLQLSSTNEQVNSATKKVSAGVLAESQLADLQTQAATEEINLANAKSNFEVSKLDLFLAMNYNAKEDMSFVPPAENSLLDAAQLPDAAAVYQSALNFFPDIKSAELRKQAASFDIKIARSYYFPTLSLYGYLGTTYSSSVTKTLFVPDGTSTTIVNTSATNYINVAGSDYYVKEVQQVKNGYDKPFTYFNQLDANLNAGAGLSLRIPLLNAFQAKYKTAAAKANLQRLNTQTASVKNQLQNAVEQSIQNLKIASERILLTEKQIKALKQSLDNSTARISAGTSNAIEYLLVKTNYDRAVVNLIQFKYEYQLRYAIVQFYQTGKW